MTQPSAKIILDSLNDWGQRLVTMEVVMHRFILAEMNTHRVFSRNSASSRAIPYHKIRNRVSEDIAWPVHWGQEQKGMQSGEAVNDEALIRLIKNRWRDNADASIFTADVLHELGLHKSLINRLLEPFMWHTAIITATDWDNFFHQRCDPAAQPEMKAVADAMQLAYYTSTPTPRMHGEWHLPYITGRDYADLETVYDKPSDVLDNLKRVSVARCARVSYLTHEGLRDINLDIELYNKLKSSGHWSPFEHVATPIKGRSGNFNGWKQFRKSFPTENAGRFIPNLPELAHIRMKMEAGVV